MKILIVGATGMVGQSVLRECLLAADVEEVTVLVRLPLTQQHAKFKQLVAADLFTSDEVAARSAGLRCLFLLLGRGIKRHDGG